MKSILIVKLGALGDIYDTIIYLTDLSKKCDVTFVVHERFSGPLQFFCPDIKIIKLKDNSIFSYISLIRMLMTNKFSKIAILVNAPAIRNAKIVVRTFHKFRLAIFTPMTEPENHKSRFKICKSKFAID